MLLNTLNNGRTYFQKQGMNPPHPPRPRCRYGLVYPGLGWVIWRSKEYLPESIVFHVNYLGSDQASVTLNFSRGAGMIIAQYYQVILIIA